MCECSLSQCCSCGRLTVSPFDVVKAVLSSGFGHLLHRAPLCTDVHSQVFEPCYICVSRALMMLMQNEMYMLLMNVFAKCCWRCSNPAGFVCCLAEFKVSMGLRVGHSFSSLSVYTFDCRLTLFSYHPLGVGQPTASLGYLM